MAWIPVSRLERRQGSAAAMVVGDVLRVGPIALVAVLTVGHGWFVVVELSQ